MSAEVCWRPTLVDAFWQVCRTVIDRRQAVLLESKLRKGTGTENLAQVHSCQCPSTDHEGGGGCSSSANAQQKYLGPYCFRKSKDDTLGDLLQRYTSKAVFIADFLPQIAERAARVYYRCISEQPADTSKSQKAELQRLCLTTAITSTLEAAVSAERARSRQFEVKDGGLVAYPTSFRLTVPDSPFLELNSIPADAMTKIMNNEVALISNWLPDDILQLCRSNYEWLEMNNVMNDHTPMSPDPYRTDSGVWLSGADVSSDEVKVPGLKYLLQKMASLPFEVNSKAQLNLTVSNDALFGLYIKGAYYRTHTDNLCGQNDNGRSLTTLFFLKPEDLHQSSGHAASDEADPMDIDIEFDRKQRDGNQVNDKQSAVIPLDNSVLIFRTRNRPYALGPARQKTYLVSHWCNGPDI